MPAPTLVVDVNLAALSSTEQRNAFAILTHVSLDRFNSIKSLLHLPVPNVLGPTTLAAFLRYCLNAGLDLSSDGVRRFKMEKGLDPDKPILEVTAEAYCQDLGIAGAVSAEAPWMAYAHAELAARVREFPGDADNPRIVEYLRTTNLAPPEAGHDSTSWCSAFVNWCMLRADIRRTRSAMARSWLQWGDALTAPRYGCVTVLATEPAPHGHVALFLEEHESRLLVLGGNQGDAVSRAHFSKHIVVGYRWPKPEYSVAAAEIQPLTPDAAAERAA